MYRLIEQSATEARQSFIATLREMSSSKDEELVVVVRRHGDPVAGIISASELGRFFRWKGEQVRARQPNRARTMSPDTEAAESPTDVARL